MSDEHHVETEGGFGTGLRAQLAKRQDSGEAADAQQPSAPQAAQVHAVEVEVRAADGATFAELESLRVELSSALTRERELRTTLESRLATEPQGPPAFAADLEHRSAAPAERERELSAPDRERTEAAATLAKQEAALAERERSLERIQAQLSAQEQEAGGRAEAHESALAVREAALRDRENEFTDRDRSTAGRERELAKAEAAMVVLDEKLHAREAEVQAKERKLWAEGQRIERDKRGRGEVDQQALARLSELDELEGRLAAREAELNRRAAEVRREERENDQVRDLDQLGTRLDERERALAARESELVSSEALFDSQRSRLER